MSQPTTLLEAIRYFSDLDTCQELFLCGLMLGQFLHE